MEKEEIISGLQFTIDMFLFDPMTGEVLTEPRNKDDKVTIDACKGAIELLKSEPYEDCISRQAVLEVLKKNRYRFSISQEGNCEGNVLWSEKLIKDNACKEIEQLSSAIPNKKTGHWISFGAQGEIDGQIVRTFTCSKCGAISIFRMSNGNIINGGLCPNCGAKMIESSENDNEVDK